MQRVITIALTLLALAYLPGPMVHAQSRFVKIDATEPEKLDDAIEKYREAVLGSNRDRLHRTRIYLTVDARIGFDAGLLEIPSSRRSQNVDVILNIKGGAIRAPIKVNVAELDGRRIKQINQRIRVR